MSLKERDKKAFVDPLTHNIKHTLKHLPLKSFKLLIGVTIMVTITLML